MSFDFTVKEFILGSGTGTPTLQFYKRGFELNGGGESPSWQDIILSGTTALTLTNALANSLNYVKLFGKCEQRNLPSGHQQLESLTSDGNAYIDTGFKPTNKTKIDITFSTSTTQHFLFGSRKGTTGDDQQRFAMYIAESSDTVKLNPQFANSNYPNVSPVLSTNTKFNVVMDSAGVKLDGTLVQVFTSETFIGEYNLVLFGNNTAGTIATAENTIYSTKIYEDGVLVRYYIPDNYNGTLGMYDLVNNVFYPNAGTGTFTAGADVTAPSPDYPMDIVSNNGVVKVSKNLFDYRYFYSNYTVPSTSTVGRVAIKLLPNTNYTVSTNTQQSSTAAQVWTASGSDPNAFSPVTTTNGVLVDSPRTVQSDNNGYIILALRVGTEYEIKESDFESGNVWVQIEQGSTVTPYTPYSPNGIYTDGTVETVEVHGKNLFDKNAITNGYAILADGSLDARYNFGYTNLIPILQTTYFISGITKGAANWNLRVHGYDSNGDWVEQISSTNVTTGVTTASFTVNNSSIKSIKLSIGTVDRQNLDTLQLEQGSTATTYEPYFNGGSATAQDLYAVGTYQDVQSVLDGAVARNVGIKVLDGSEDWTEIGTIGTNDYRFSGSGIISVKSGANVSLCTHIDRIIQANTASQSGRPCIRFATSSGAALFYATDNSMTLENWVQWLKDCYNSGNPVIVIYPLATATTESVTAQPLSTQAGTNIVEITQASIDNLELEVSYKATV